MIETNRRGFLAFLGAGLVAAPAIVRAASLMSVKAIDQIVNEPIFGGEFGTYNGIIIRYRKEIFRDYVRENLFTPYIGPPVYLRHRSARVIARPLRTKALS